MLHWLLGARPARRAVSEATVAPVSNFTTDLHFVSTLRSGVDLSWSRLLPLANLKGTPSQTHLLTQLCVYGPGFIVPERRRSSAADLMGDPHQRSRRVESAGPSTISFFSNVPDGVILEGLLKQASEEEAWRPAFYRQLMKSDVLVILPSKQTTINAVLPGTIDLIHWKRTDGTAATPIFSSTRTLLEAVPGGTECLVLTVRQLLASTRGALLHLNPLSDFGVELRPSDVEAL